MLAPRRLRFVAAALALAASGWGCDTSADIDPVSSAGPALLTSPGRIYDGDPVTMRWTPVEDALWYEVAYTARRRGEEVSVRDSVTATRYVFASEPGTYSWRVRAHRVGSFTAWRGVRFVRDRVVMRLALRWRLDEPLAPNTRYFLDPEVSLSAEGRLGELGISVEDGVSARLDAATLRLAEPENTRLNLFTGFRVLFPGMGGAATASLPDPTFALSAPLVIHNPELPTGLFGDGDMVRLQVQTGDEAPPAGSYLFEADGELLLTVQT